jgi:hypothetical protein
MPHRFENSKSARRGKRASTTAAELRTRVAAEAARLIAETGIRDYAFAKQKAAWRLGANDDAALPKNSEIDAALHAHFRLFEAEDHARLLRELRLAAIEAMRFLAEFEPRLVDAVLEGTADRHSAICLHLFSDDPDAPVRFLDDRGIRHDLADRRVRVTRDEFSLLPTISFAADEVPIDLTVFPLDALRHAPVDRTGTKPMQRATLSVVEGLLESMGDTKL